jgi:hypothetical protein
MVDGACLKKSHAQTARVPRSTPTIWKDGSVDILLVTLLAFAASTGGIY